MDDADTFPLDSTRFTDTGGDGIGGNLDMGSIVGTWKLAPVAGALGVGPEAGNIDWLSNEQHEVAGEKACLFDDTYTFGADGSFSQEMGGSTYLESWQGGAADCGAPVAPHDGSATDATFTYENDVLTITGYGAHLGLAKVVNGGELSTVPAPPAVPASINYNITLMSADGLNMTATIEAGSGVFWTFRFVKVLDNDVDNVGDGIGNNADTDGDGDGVSDTTDAFPLDASETVDTDGDGIGNNADTDDDGDGVMDDADAFPLDASETVDTDGDGIGNNADTDDDGDGVMDDADTFPLDSTRFTDASGDGILVELSLFDNAAIDDA